jgi:hypothetical protein
MFLLSNNSSILLLIKAGLKKSQPLLFSSNRPATLPNIVLSETNINIDFDALNGFHRLTSLPRLHGEVIHPCYPHLLAFNLHMQLMLHPEFPFAMLGLVHIHNQITQVKPILATDSLDLSCRFGDVKRHRKGWVFDIETEVMSGGEKVWSSVSTNLFKVKLPEERDADTNSQEGEKSSLQPVHQESWVLGAELGRQYARISKDYNLIHLHPLAAKLFGFKRHIAHGMWTKAQCLSALVDQGTRSFECQVAFKKPIFLANNVRFSSASEQLQTDFSVTDLSQSICHLKGIYSKRQNSD